MKRRAPLAAAGLSLALLAGCGERSPSSSDTSAASSTSVSDNSSGNPVTAPVDYLGAVAQGRQSALKTIDTAQLKQAIQNFQATEDRPPASLDELVAKGHLRQLPAPPPGMKLQYDPKTGAVSIVKI
jgi:hypothetical protein